MSRPTTSRQQILARVRAATSTVAKLPAELAPSYSLIERKYVRKGGMTARARTERFIERLREYDAEVVETAPAELPATIASQLAASVKKRFVAPVGLPKAWLAEGFEWHLDGELSAAEIELAEGVVTGAFCGVADSGTIVMHHGVTEGRRVISLLPDWHLCILYASQLVETLPEYFDRCAQAPSLHPSDEDLSLGTLCLATYISGPSATADIEMTRIKGVHGPRFLHVIVVNDGNEQ